MIRESGPVTRSRAAGGLTMHLSSTQAFHHRWCAALAASDTAALEQLYHPDAVQLSVGGGQGFVGASAVVAGYAELFSVVGGVTTSAVESFIDLGDAYVVESAQSSSFMQAKSYDVFALEHGRARVHVTGSITPRGAGTLPAESGTAPGQVFYRRLWEATSAKDAAALSRLYAPDAVHASPLGVVRGGPSIVQQVEQGWQRGAETRLESVSSLLEDRDVLAVEGVASFPSGGARLHIEFYEVWMLRAGQAVLAVSGLIRPRPAELRETMRRLADAELKAVQTVTEGLARTIPRPWW